MSYQIDFSDKPNNPSIVVEDATLNTERSLSFPGKNFPGYSKAIGENFLHLLENFAKASPPSNPVTGQLWYDTNITSTTPQPQLKVWDGVTWTAAGNVKKATTRPLASNSVIGDLWVDTANQQLYLWSGSTWILVGPQFSEGQQSGTLVETITDTLNNTHIAVNLICSGIIVAIISKDSEYTPKIVISGFETIKPGINVSSAYKFNGTAEKAESLIVSNTVVPASKFLRSDVASTTDAGINIRSNSGLAVGAGLTTLLNNTSAGETVLANNVEGSRIFVRVRENNVALDVVTVSGTNVGINKTNPIEALDVVGNVHTNASLIVTGTEDSSSLSTGSIRTSGGASITKSLHVGSTASIAGTLTSSSIVPLINNTADLGSDLKRFKAIYANQVGNDDLSTEFKGQFTGSFSGSVTGTASKLVSPTTFRLTGDVSSNTFSFNGQGATTVASTIAASGNGTQVTLTFTEQPTVPFTTGMQITVTGIQPAAYQGTYTVLSGTTSSVTYASTATGIQTVPGTIIASTEATFSTVVSSDFITTKTEAFESYITDELIINRVGTGAGSGTRKISKSTFLSNVATMPIGAIVPFAGTVVPNGYLLCDGSEQYIASYPQLFATIGYAYKALGLLQGVSTFALPDLRGRFPLGLNSMDNGSLITSKEDGVTQLTTLPPVGSSRVTDTASSTIAAIGGSEARTLSTINLPDHSHTMQGNAGNQYYAFRNEPGLPADTNAISGFGPTEAATGQYLEGSGGVKSSETLGQPVNVTNPYTAINYIIFTGRIV